MKKIDGVLEKVRILEKKNGIVYAKTDGKLYKSLKKIAVVFFIYTMLFNVLFILSMSVRNSATYESSTSNNIIIISVCSIIALIGVILMFRKKHLLGAVITLVSFFSMLPVYANYMKDDLNGFLGFMPSFYWRHFVPIVITIILVLWLSIIAIREIIKTNKLYKKVLDNLFLTYKISNGEEDNITEEQWIEFLENYNTNKNQSILSK